MGLVINKMKRELMADYLFGLSVLVIIINLGWFIYLPISQLIETRGFISLSNIFPLKLLLYPILGFSVAGFSIYLSRELKNEDSWAGETYESLGAGTLLILAIIAFFSIAIISNIWAHIFGL